MMKKRWKQIGTDESEDKDDHWIRVSQLLSALIDLQKGKREWKRNKWERWWKIIYTTECSIYIESRRRGELLKEEEE